MPSIYTPDATNGAQPADTDYVLMAAAELRTLKSYLQTQLAALAGGSINNALTFRNKIINGAMAIDQRNGGASQTITAGAALAYTVDRLYAYCSGANVTGQQVAGAIANTFRYQFTGAASNTGVGFGTRLEAVNTAMYAGSTMMLSCKLKSTSLTTVTWTAYYANTKDTFGSLATPTRTQIATGTFNINSTETVYNTTIAIPSAATTGIEIVLSTTALLGSQTLTIGDIQLEPGTYATPFEHRPLALERTNCERYCRIINISLGGGATPTATNRTYSQSHSWAMRSTPTETILINTDSSAFMNTPAWTNLTANGGLVYTTNTAANDCAYYGQYRIAAEL